MRSIQRSSVEVVHRAQSTRAEVVHRALSTRFFFWVPPAVLRGGIVGQ